jgi:hypothetical protein
VETTAVRLGLARVREHGAPAQRVEAQRLTVLLESSPGETAVLIAAEQLIDAYLNDPYLEKLTGD